MSLTFTVLEEFKEATAGSRMRKRSLTNCLFRLFPPLQFTKKHMSSGPDHKSQAHKIVNQVQEIIGDILAISPSGTAQSLPLNGNCRFDELFAETSP